MKKFWRDLLLAFLMGAVLPSVIVHSVIPTETEEPFQTTITTETVRESTEEIPSCKILLRQTDGSVTEAELEQYLVGVVLAEMPANFEDEALKAQSVVARTYTLKNVEGAGKHGDGSICTDSQCCQAYISVMDYLERDGTGESVNKVRSAVSATAGEVLVYEGQLIEATYFSCSGGITEDAQAVWGTDYPYLKSVVSPGEEEAAVFTDTVSFSGAQFQERLGVTLSGNPRDWFGDVSYTAGNGVDVIMIDGERYEGKDLRKLLGLRSTNFVVETDEDQILFHTKGYGHRVGMSQYGADAMAVNGCTYEEILAYYYQGTELTDAASVMQ